MRAINTKNAEKRFVQNVEKKLLYPLNEGILYKDIDIPNNTVEAIEYGSQCI